MSPEIIGSSVLLAGFGREGKSTLKYIQNHYPNMSVSIADSNANLEATINGVENIYTGENYLREVNKFDTVVRSPGIPRDLPGFKEARHLTSAMNIFFSECPGTIIGITGTKGKSTTTSLIHHILKDQFDDVRLVGNIGIPALGFLDDAKDNTIFVTELSSYQLDDIRYSPHIAVLLAISQEHLSYHGSMDNYVHAKSHIVEYQSINDFVVYSKDNKYAKNIANSSLGANIENGSSDSRPVSAWNNNEAIHIKTRSGEIQSLIELSKLPLIGKANIINATAAVIVALLCDVKPSSIKSSIETFLPLEHRLEPAGTYAGIKFYNDSLATTPDAAINAIEAFSSSAATLIAGGYDRGLDYTDLGKYIAKSSIKNLLLFPDTGKEIEKSVRDSDPKTTINFVSVHDMKQAVQLAYELTPRDTTCIMSPAAASFNLFKDYADRGNQFKELVKEIGTKIDNT